MRCAPRSARRDEPAAGDHPRGTSFFLESIGWVPKSGTVFNGQHRSCALKLAGVPRCVVDLDGHAPVREPRSARQRALEEIAAFWQVRSAPAAAAASR